MRHHRPVLVVFLPFVAGYFLTYLFRSVNASIAADLSSELALDPAELGLLTSIYFLAVAAIQLPLGIWLDRYGPRRVQSILLPVAASGAVLFATAQSFWALVLGRALIGLGVAGGLMAGLKAIVQWFPKERLATINGCFVMIGAFGAVTATAPVELLLRFAGWRGLFIILGGITACCALLICFVVPQPSSDNTVGSTAAGAEGLKTIFTDPRFWRIAPLAATCIGTSWALQGLWAASWFSDVEKFERTAVVWYLFLMAIVLSVAAMGLGIAGDQLRRRGISTQRTLTSAALLFIVAQFAVILRWSLPPYLLWSLIAGFGTATVLNFAILAEHYPKEMVGRANAALNMVHLGGALVVQSVTGVIIQQWTSENGHYPAIAYQVAFAFNVSLQILALIWYTWPERERRDPALKIRVPQPAFHFDPIAVAPYQNAARVWDDGLKHRSTVGDLRRSALSLSLSCSVSGYLPALHTPLSCPMSLTPSQISDRLSDHTPRAVKGRISR
jgi:MFS family permease